MSIWRICRLRRITTFHLGWILAQRHLKLSMKFRERYSNRRLACRHRCQRLPVVHKQLANNCFGRVIVKWNSRFTGSSSLFLSVCQSTRIIFLFSFVYNWKKDIMSKQIFSFVVVVISFVVISFFFFFIPFWKYSSVQYFFLVVLPFISDSEDSFLSHLTSFYFSTPTNTKHLYRNKQINGLLFSHSSTAYPGGERRRTIREFNERIRLKKRTGLHNYGLKKSFYRR